MKKLQAILLALVVVAISAVPASAKFRIGPRVGIDVNALRMNSSVFDKDNRAGFTGGIEAEYTIPVINLAVDLSVMYVHRVSKATVKDGQDADQEELLTNSRFKNRDYIEIPLAIKYKIGLPVIGKVFSPYVFTGPSFSVLASKKSINEAYQNKAFDVAWNFGLGIQLFTHLQVGASYGIGMTNTVEKASGNKISGAPIEGKNNYWTVTAAWLF
ncbi:MAG: PorT family protein [Muribaculaceae bacterium]|nr:PorT family protein [Muribaculaceae bacterium]